MGRRKIEIEPITDERNRTVTFIKRKAGLFKKAHELAVLCQVDVALIILGHNNTFYEFSSVDTNDLLDHYQNDKSLLHDIKDPSFYGKNFAKKKCIHNHDHDHTTSTTTATINNSTITTANADDDPKSMTNHKSKRSLSLLTNSHSNPNHLNKKFRVELNNTSHPIITNNSSNTVGTKTSLSNVINSNSSSTSKDAKLLSSLNSDSNSNSNPSSLSSSNSHKKLSSRPILRVQIPHSNMTINNTTNNNTTSSADSIKSEFSGINPNVYGNTSPQNYRMLSSDITNINNQNINLSKQSSILNKNSDPSNLLKHNQTSLTNITDNALKMPNSSTTFSSTNGLLPLSTMSPYIATLLQNSNFHPPLIKTNTNNIITTTTAFTKAATPTDTQNGTNKFGLKLNINKINSFQKYPQQNIPNKPLSSIYSLASTSDSSPHNGNASNINSNNNNNNNNNNTSNNSLLSGPLSSKYINDLMIPSPTVFSNWNVNLSIQSAGAKLTVPPNPIRLANNTNIASTPISNSNIGTTIGATNSTIINNNSNTNRSNSMNDVSSSSSSSLVLVAQGYDLSNGNTGLTPYIGIGQTPLTNRFFNFSTSNINSPDAQVRKNEPLTTATTPTTNTTTSVTTTTNIPNNVNNIKTESIDTPTLDKDNKN